MHTQDALSAADFPCAEYVPVYVCACGEEVDGPDLCDECEIAREQFEVNGQDIRR